MFLYLESWASTYNSKTYRLFTDSETKSERLNLLKIKKPLGGRDVLELRFLSLWCSAVFFPYITSAAIAYRSLRTNGTEKI